MASPLALILQPPRTDGPPLVRALADAREALGSHHAAMLTRAGARVAVEPVTGAFAPWLADRLAGVDGAIVMGSGSVPLLRPADAARLVAVAAAGRPELLTNNRWSSDVLATGAVPALVALLRSRPSIGADNALPRLLAEAGVTVHELRGRERLALDIDTPLDIALVARVRGAPPFLRSVAAAEGLAIPRLDALRSVVRDPRAELLVAGRSGAATLRRLERTLPCRVRFLAEERGLRAAAGSPGPGGGPARPPRTTLGRLLALRGPDALGSIVGELADAAILDTRTLLADRLGPDEAAWPAPEDRFAADLLRADDVRDPWLQALTASAAAAPIPILTGSHTLVGPGIRWLLE